MSGIEVAGLLLSAVPLLIAALEGYQKLGKKRDAFARRSIHIGKMIRSLRAQHSLIQGDLEIVLRNADVDMEHIENLAYTTMDSILSRDEVKIEVENFLGSHYLSYKQVLEDCGQVLLELARCISTFREGSWNAQGSLMMLLRENQHLTATPKDVWKRVQFSMKKDEIDRAIQELDRATFQLQRMSQQSTQLKQINITYVSSKTKARVSLLRKVQRKAAVLHQGLTRSWNAQCRHPRQARLYLEARLDEGENPQMRAALTKPTSKNVAFRVTLEGKGDQTHSFLYTCNVHATEEDSLADMLGRVTFSVSAPSTPTTPTISVKDICQLVHSFRAGPNILQLFIDNGANLHYCNHLEPYNCVPSPNWPWQPSMISLRDVLQAKSIHFSRKLRVRMAALVASSVLQLHTTPWAGALREHTIFFIQNVTGNVELQHPFVASQFDSNGSQVQPQPRQGEADLLELGIIILALWEKEPLEAYAQRKGLVVDDTYDVRQSIARKWLFDLEDEFLTSLYEAALRCINCRFDAATIDLSNAKINQDVFELVVKPLWDNCNH